MLHTHCCVVSAGQISLLLVRRLNLPLAGVVMALLRQELIDHRNTSRRVGAVR